MDQSPGAWSASPARHARMRRESEPFVTLLAGIECNHPISLIFGFCHMPIICTPINIKLHMLCRPRFLTCRAHSAVGEVITRINSTCSRTVRRPHATATLHTRTHNESPRHVETHVSRRPTTQLARHQHHAPPPLPARHQLAQAPSGTLHLSCTTQHL